MSDCGCAKCSWTPKIDVARSARHVVHVTTSESEAQSIAANLLQYFTRNLVGKRASYRAMSNSFVVEVEVNNADQITLQRIFDAVRFYNIGRESSNHF